ncbi:hypothetical protein HY623_03295 [Candidatus Uhrbacteria bacterium]|nr:hypothetical protein [Candidatus Uhrbacteria bacterium]
MKKFFLLFGIALFLATPTLAFGASVLENALYADPTSETNKLLNKFVPGAGVIKTPGVIVFEVLQIILGFLGIVGVIMMIYAGFLWLTAGGEEEKAKQGRTILFQAIIGILIVLASYTITYFIIAQLTTAVVNR